MKILVTGGCGFIGSNLVRYLFNETNHSVVNVDKLTYAANLKSLADIEPSPRYTFYQNDIVDSASIHSIFNREQPDAIIHLAAESHVDRSITAPQDFIQTNVTGTFHLLNCSLDYFDALNETRKDHFRFIHVSTDEVFGSLSLDDPAVTELAPYAPSSPYSASKAGSDHLALAWHVTHGLPVIVTHSANNFGAYQYPEKFIPTIISKASNQKRIPIYGNGQNVRDWLYVEDHAKALHRLLTSGTPGETYNIGAENELSNIDVAKQVCAILDELHTPAQANESYAELIDFVTDRKGHDFRYALDTTKIRTDLDWKPTVSWEAGIRKTVQWYLDNKSWWQPVLQSATA